MKTSNIASSDALGGHHGGADFRGWVGLGGRGHDGSPWTTEEVPRFTICSPFSLINLNS